MLKKSVYKVSVNEQERAMYTVGSEPYYQLVLVSGESGKRVLDSTDSEFKILDMVLLPPGCRCTWESNTGKEDIKVIMLAFDNFCLKESFLRQDFLSEMKTFISNDSNTYIFQDADIIEELKDDILSLTNSGNFESDISFLKILHKLSKSVYHLYASSSTSTHHDQCIYKAKNYIDNNFAKELTLADVAKYVYMSSSRFCSLFSQKMQITFQDYRTKVRIEESALMLQQWKKGDTINAIADNCGYPSVHNFRKAFRKIYGMTPTEYRDDRTKWQVE